MIKNVFMTPVDINYMDLTEEEKQKWIDRDKSNKYLSTTDNKITLYKEYTMTPKEQNTYHGKKILEEVMMDCLKIINPEIKDCTQLDEIGEQIFDRLVYDKLTSVIDLLTHDLGHINDVTRSSILMDYETALKLFKSVL